MKLFDRVQLTGLILMTASDSTRQGATLLVPTVQQHSGRSDFFAYV